MLSDFYLITYWWFLIFTLGICALPLSWLFFHKFFDSGYAFSKIIGLLIISYLAWLFGSLKIFAFSLNTLYFCFFLLVFASLLIIKIRKNEIVKELQKRWPIYLGEEILFFVCLVFWSFVRGFGPDVEGLEKFMDFGFMNSILKSQYFPPLDMWFAGKTINYYYFGHLVSAVLTKLSGLDPSIGYNLMIATLFAFSFTAVFSLSGNLFYLVSNLKEIKKIIFGVFMAGIISATLFCFGGNWHPLWWSLTHNGSMTNYWYPDATRFIVEKSGASDNTIHEFPIYSFVVSDLHGHVSNIPFVLLFLALLFSLIISQKLLTLNFKLLTSLSLVAAVMYMTNSWDFPIYSLILGLIILWVNYQNFGLSIKTIFQTMIFSIIYFLLSIIFSLPFHLNFTQIAQGVALVHAHSPFWQLLILWGYQWLIGLGFILFLLLKKRLTKNLLQTSEIFIMILLGVATILIVIPEIIYIKDIYISSYHRANTMFKLVYQSFGLYAIASGFIITRIIFFFKNRFFRFILVVSFFLVIFYPLYYPAFAINSYYGNLKYYKTLYGLNFLSNSSPDDYQTLLWLNKNISGQPIILEAVGDSYTLYGRFSSLSGLPTVQGWVVHEWLWRGSYDEPGKRSEEVKTIYETSNQQTALDLIRKYHVEYVTIGDQERLKYKISEGKFAKLGKIVFTSGKNKIYKIEDTN
jgi:uncharacterized membrane protein